MKYFSAPNLPNKQVSAVVADIKLNGIKVFPTMFVDSLPVVERKHADLQIVHLFDNTFICPPECVDYYSSILPYCNIIAGNSSLKNEYPYNVAYNVCIVGKKIICNAKTVDDKLLYLIREKYDIINVKQGYAKCSVCIVDENAVITSDKGIAKVLINNDFDVLNIIEGYIKLPGFDHGFIGGCSGKIAPDIIYFNGDLSKHPDYNRIIEFASKHNCQCKFDNSFELTDIGSILPIY